MNILLTGANSFLGRHLTASLVAQGISIVGTYRTETPAIAQLRRIAGAGSLELVAVDLADASAYRSLPTALDAIVHVAGVSAAPDVGLDEMLACNVTGARNLVAYGLRAGADKLIYASTLSVHGQIGVPSVDTDTPILNPDVYGASKYLAERIFAASADRLPAAAIRLPGVLGPGAHRAWIPMLMEAIHAGLPLTIFNPDSPFNNAAHVDDLARMTETMLRTTWNGFHAFPVAAAGMTTIRGVVERLVAGAGKRATVTVSPSRRPSFTVSSDYAKQRFGYRPGEIGAMVDRYVAEFHGQAGAQAETMKGQID